MAFAANTTAALAVATTLSGCFIGCGLTLSYMAVPSLLLASNSTTKASDLSTKFLDNAARSWHLIYKIGAKVGPITGAIGAALYVYAARSLPVASVMPRRLLYVAAVANILVGPFTMAVMAKTNTEIMRRTEGRDEHDGRKGAESGSLQGMKTEELLNRWAGLNAWRSIFPAAAVGLTVGAVML